MRRLVIVYNPLSSHYRKIKREVIEVLKGEEGFEVVKFEVAQVDVNENAKNLSRVIRDDDLVISAGGDGTAAAAMNGVMLTAAKNVRFGTLGFGNFNDMARTFGDLKLKEILHGDTEEVWPLECRINGKHWRYAMCYLTAGMFAVACGVFDHPKTRHALRHGNKRVTFSMGVLARWWLKCHKMQKFLPEKFQLVGASGEAVTVTGASDYLAVNSKTVARIMRGGRWSRDKSVFWSSTGKLTKIFKLASFMIRSVLRRVPGIESEYDRLEFARPTTVMVQTEGEYVKFGKVQTIEVRKATRPILVVKK